MSSFSEEKRSVQLPMLPTTDKLLSHFHCQHPAPHYAPLCLSYAFNRWKNLGRRHRCESEVLRELKSFKVFFFPFKVRTFKTSPLALFVLHLNLTRRERRGWGRVRDWAEIYLEMKPTWNPCAGFYGSREVLSPSLVWRDLSHNQFHTPINLCWDRGIPTPRVPA